MNKDKALESVNEIKELMEKSSKFISISGLAAIMAGVYALAGTYIATCLVTPDTTLIVALKLMIMVAILVLAAAAVTAGILSYNKSKKLRQKFFSKLTYRALWNFSLPMLTGGALCISLLLHGYYDILSSVMLLFYGLTLVNVSKFTDAANRRYMNFSELNNVGMKFEPKNQGVQYVDIQHDTNSVTFL